MSAEMKKLVERHAAAMEYMDELLLGNMFVTESYDLVEQGVALMNSFCDQVDQLKEFDVTKHQKTA